MVLLDFTVCTHLAEEVSGSLLLFRDLIPLFISEVSKLFAVKPGLDFFNDRVELLEERLELAPVECSRLDGLSSDHESF